MNELFNILLATIIVSLISFVGAFTLAMRVRDLKKYILVLVALSAGALMGGAFLHLIPASIKTLSVDVIFLYVLVGFSLFFMIEKVLHWRHCHKHNCKVHSFAYMNLVGDGVHNFIDGLIIAASFMVDVQVGMVSTLAIILHEVPQEIGDFGVLLHGGFSKVRALFLNFLSALTAILGGFVGYLLSNIVESFTAFLLPFAAGGFIYIAASDLIPELRKETGMKKAMVNFLIFLIGIFLMYLVKFLE
ncbi:ZIP family metal transporter [archaeon]|jgi:zinc and cadmium transporter|nr:ZIP family metal transporter [archaeon]